MIFVPTFLTYHFFPLVCLFYCNLSHYFDRRWKRLLGTESFPVGLTEMTEAAAGAGFWCLWQCERSRAAQAGRGISQVHHWLLGNIMEPTNMTQDRGGNFLLKFKWPQKTRHQNMVSQHVLWTCPRGKIPAVYWSKQVILIPEILQNIPRVLRKNCQIYCWTATHAALPGHM